MSQQWAPPPPPISAPANVPNYLIPAILSVFCCWPLSIVAIIFGLPWARISAATSLGGNFWGPIQPLEKNDVG